MDEEAVLAANTAFYEAFEARDLAAMAEVWERSDRIVCIHPGWPLLRGWEPVMRSWAGLFSGPQRLQFVLTGAAVAVEGRIAWVSLDENLLEGGVGGAVAAVNVFAAAGSSWKMVVHHGSAIVA